jgi:hypothetical protein
MGLEAEPESNIQGYRRKTPRPRKLGIFRIGKMIFSCYAQEHEKQSKLLE